VHLSMPVDGPADTEPEPEAQAQEEAKP
jgi:hypothetical protein